MQRRRGQRGNNAQDDGTSRKLSKKPSEDKFEDKEKAKRGAGVFRKLGFILHPDKDKQENGSTQKRRKPKKGTERKRKMPVWNPDKKVHFNIEKPSATIPLKGDPISDIQKKVFFKFASDAVKKSPPEYSIEFLSKIKPYPGQPLERKIFDANPTKNRYKDVICNDITRVILNDGYDNDYIHANYVNGLNTPFILTQGPTAATVVDFWRMIVHTKTAYIVMLCEVMEDGKAKCAQYFPEKVGEAITYAPWTILCSLEDDKDTNIIKRTLCVKNGDTGKEHILKHLHTKSWPDRSVPNSTMSLLRMLFITRTASGPVTVHCSAGIGRTGTFVAMEACLQILTDGKDLDLQTTCKALRNSRAGSVQVDIQYMTLVQVLINYGKDNGYWEDADLDDRVELLTWNIQQFIQTRGKVDHLLATPSTPALNIPPATTTPPPPPPAPVKEPTPHQSPVQKAQECMEKICEKILKPIKKEKEQKDHKSPVEHKSPNEGKEHHKDCKEYPLPLTTTKSSTEDGEEADDLKMQATQKVEVKETKETVVQQQKDEDAVHTVPPGPPPMPSPAALVSPKTRKDNKESKDSTDSKESKDNTIDLNMKVSKELALEKRSKEKDKIESKESNFKLTRKQSANRSQYFM
uniref:Tyrosine-protein phosphatase domain-containing protein n=1 Tax=Caenorhabditis tropicalis TaxID=1561998 RepID=A0A1I7T086_9PELO